MNWREIKTIDEMIHGKKGEIKIKQKDKGRYWDFHITVSVEVAQALARQSFKESVSPEKLIQRIVRDWLVGRGNLRIY